jgi:hypothetical protein
MMAETNRKIIMKNFVFLSQNSSKNGLSAYLFSLKVERKDKSVKGREMEMKMDNKQKPKQTQRNVFGNIISEMKVKLALILELREKLDYLRELREKLDYLRELRERIYL